MLIALSVVLAFIPNSRAIAQEQLDESAALSLAALNNESPRATLRKLLTLRTSLEEAVEVYRNQRNRANGKRVRELVSDLSSLIDLSKVPPAAQQITSIETVSYLLNIIARVPLPELSDVPGVDSFDSNGRGIYRIPGTPLKIVQMIDGPRELEFLFSPDTVQVAPRIHSSVVHFPTKPEVRINDWRRELLQGTGPMIPGWLQRNVPSALTKSILDTPYWKVLIGLVAILLVSSALILWHKVTRNYSTKSVLSDTLLQILSPVVVIIAASSLARFFENQLLVVGRLSSLVSLVQTFVTYVALAYIVWLLVIAATQGFMQRVNSEQESIDRNMLRLIGRVIGAVAAIIVLAFGADALGLPVLSVMAGLGIGGIAVALAVRPTLENLIGGFILYIDRPIRVGDFCSFGDRSGTVETIGVRSTQIRALDRTLITIPNAQFADMELINWAECDQMMIDHVIGLRYETGADQLRYVLAKIREMFLGHPRIDNDTIRVRFYGYGASSLDIHIRIYARTREWNDFYAVREDVMLRIKDIVEDSGTSFAFPSSTLYLSRDAGLDTEKSTKAGDEVDKWRRSNRLPFPSFSSPDEAKVEDRLSYPPIGSPDYAATNEELASGGERLSAADPEEESCTNASSSSQKT